MFRVTTHCSVYIYSILFRVLNMYYQYIAKYFRVWKKTFAWLFGNCLCIVIYDAHKSSVLVINDLGSDSCFK